MERSAGRWTALVAAATALTVSCGLAASVYAADISVNELAGRWISKAGTSLTFHKDHTFTSEHFTASDCGDLATPESGTWAFYAFTGSHERGTPDDAAMRGSVLSLASVASSCTVTVYLFGDEDNPVMCPTGDADAGCPSDEYLRRSG
ncbi:hypothetical protein ABZT17_10145 [Streptomyces sp. NPDC005648]|uniref:hypothetical protein n=1 Tax=Streptomyces sp. NPDC005648 TaxID=3157044 RepID=UPI0033B3DA4C